MSTIQSRTVDVDGLKLHYLEAGTGDPVLLLHGWPTNAQLWRHALPQIGANRRAIALDLPGFGGSDKPLDASYSFKFYARTIDAFLAALDIERTGLAVHDLGGPAGLYWASQDVSRITDLALLNTLVYPEMSWAVKLFIGATKVPGLRRYFTSRHGLAWGMRYGVQDKSRITDEVAALYQTPFVDMPARTALLKAIGGFHPKGFVTIAEAMPTFTCPVRLIYGEADRILPDIQRTMARVQADLPQAEATAIPDCGHFLQEDRPEEVAQLLGEFFVALADRPGTP